MIDVMKKLNKYGQTAYSYEESSTKKTPFGSDFFNYGLDKTEFFMKLPIMNCSINYSYYNELYEGDHEDLTEIQSQMKIRIGKESIDINSGYLKEEGISRLVEMVVAYGYAKENLNQLMLNGMSKKELKDLSTEDLEGMLNKKMTFMQDLKNAITDISMGKTPKKTGQEMFDESFGKGKVDIDKLVEQNVEKRLAIKERETAHQMRINAVRDGIAKVGEKLRVIPNAIARKLKEHGELKQQRAEQRKEEKEYKQRRKDIIDELTM